MKNIINFNLLGVIIVFAFITGSCKKEYELPVGLTVGNDFFLTTSFGVNHRVVVNEGQEMNFNNYSTGVSSTTWTFPPDAEPSIASSAEKHAKVSFGKPGTYEVNCHIVFTSEFYYRNEPQGTNIKDTAFQITVVENIEAKPIVYDENGTKLSNTSGAKHSIDAGAEVLFEDESVGSPQTRAFIFTNTETGDTEDFIVDAENKGVYRFMEKGTYDLTYIASRTTLQHRFADTAFFPNYFEITGSTKPLLIDTIVIDDADGTITFNRPLANVSSVTATALSLTVTNSGSNVSGITVTSVQIDAQDSWKLNFKLSSRAYVSDEITVSYNATMGDITSVDGTTMGAVSGHKAYIIGTNVLKEAGIDVTIENSTNDNWRYKYWGLRYALYNQGSNVSSAQAYEGSQSLYIDLDPSGGAIIGFYDGETPIDSVELKAGITYNGSVMVYIENAGDDVSDFLLMMPDYDWTSLHQVLFDGTQTTGVWYEATYTYLATETGSYAFHMRCENESTNNSSFYLDNFVVKADDPRP